MNNIFRSIWNDKSGTFAAVSENAKAAGKKSSRGASAAGVTSRLCLKALSVSVMLAFGANVHALPVGGVVTAGGATINSGASTTTINQSTQNAVINWQSFNIAQGQTVQFVQPNVSSVALNRVVGANPSSIFGTLSANGKVFLVNPNGILFGQGASVNVGGLVASTLNITDSNFMAGNHTFSGAGAGAVLNQGNINADGGYVALLGAHVSNQGVIAANLGTVALAAGEAITLDVAGDGLLNVTVNQGAVNALAENGGLIRANGGQVLMTANAAGNLLQTVVNQTGVIEAQSLDNRNGTIRLLGAQSGAVMAGGTLDASGMGAGQTGGTVHVLGDKVALMDTNINVSGAVGGGTVLVGGDYQGKNAAVQNATATYMSTDATISADATTAGNGGKVVLWADDSTRAYGSITARGGAQSGDGGLIETSGHWLDVAGIKVNTSAPNGKYGTWLLDPADVTISSAATSAASLSGGVFSPNSGVSAANVNVADLVTALGGTNVIVTTANSGASGSGNGDINVNNPITWTAPTTLTLNADRDVNANLSIPLSQDGRITGTDGSLVVNAGRDINMNAATTTTTGNLTYTAVNNVKLNAATTITTGNLTAVAGKNVEVNAAVSVTTGDVVLRADNDGTGPGILGGTATISCGSNCITIGTGALSIRFNPVTYTSTGSEILAYDLNLTGGGTLDAKAWVFGQGDNKVYDGTTTATVSGLERDTSNTLPPVALGAVANANFNTKDVGTQKPITFESTFSDPVYALFAPFGTTPGTYLTRADITQAPLTVTANNATKVYGQTATFAPTAFTSVGLVNGETIGSVTETSPGTVATAPVAAYAITPTGATAGTFTPSNYTISYVNGVLTVTPASLTVTADNATKVYGQTATLASTAFTSIGLVNGETIGSVTETSPGTVVTAPVATYAITPTDATAGTFTPSNYVISYVNGALVVTPPGSTPPGSTPTDTTSPRDYDSGTTLPTPLGTGDTTDLALTVVDKGVDTPPELLAAAPPPPPAPVPAPNQAAPVPPAPVVVPAPAQPKPYVPPKRVPKQDRN